jgi:hypothetical protein
MNQQSTEKQIKELFQSCQCSLFYPKTAIWISCKSVTYRSHSNECGPRTLLATAIMMLHPTPSENMLLEYMSPNIAQIARTWVAATMLTGQPIIPPIYQNSAPVHLQNLSAPSKPSSLIIWHNNNTLPQLYQQRIPEINQQTAT